MEKVHVNQWTIKRSDEMRDYRKHFIVIGLVISVPIALKCHSFTCTVSVLIYKSDRWLNLNYFPYCCFSMLWT